MWVRHLASLGCVALGLFVSVRAHAACAMDTECPGEQVCENGECVVAPLPPPPPPPPPQQAAPAPQPVAPAPQPVPLAPPLAVSPVEAPPEQPRAKGPRHSKGMMVTGIVLTSSAPIGLLIAYGGVLQCSGGLDEPCNNDSQVLGGLALAAAMAGVGIPLWIIGGRRDPVPGTPQASIGPWLTPRAGGLTLQLSL